MPLYKNVNGKRIRLTADEELARLTEWQTNDIRRNLVRYKEQRRAKYPSLEEQLDMLWHEIDSTGKVSRDGEWFQQIKRIKTNHPKPTS